MQVCRVYSFNESTIISVGMIAIIVVSVMKTILISPLMFIMGRMATRMGPPVAGVALMVINVTQNKLSQDFS
jgi:hypothetical protein